MMKDTWAVMQKELNEVMHMGGGAGRGVISLLVFSAIFGVFLPLSMRRIWMVSPFWLAIWAWIPLMPVLNVIASAFAGERERHTLETLLASRLSNGAILFGKIGAAMAYGWGMVVIILVMSLITVNLAHPQGELVIYPVGIIVGALGLSLLTSGLMAGLGTLVSLRAATVRQAQQTLGIAVMLLWFGPVMAAPVIPAGWKKLIVSVLKTASATEIALAVGAVLLLLDIVFIAAAIKRFKRAQLILD
jgi:ABC-2 type transport system permease protein